MPNEITTPRPLRRFRSGGNGAMVEDDNGGYVRFDELLDWLLLFEARLRSLPVAKPMEQSMGRVS